MDREKSAEMPPESQAQEAEPFQPQEGSEELFPQEMQLQPNVETYTLNLTEITQEKLESEDNPIEDAPSESHVQESQEQVEENTSFDQIKPSETDTAKQLKCLTVAERMALIKCRNECTSAEKVADKMIQNSCSQLDRLLQQMRSQADDMNANTVRGLEQDKNLQERFLEQSKSAFGELFSISENKQTC